MMKREFRKIERSAADKERLRKRRNKLDALRPSLESLSKSGEFQIVEQGDYQEQMRLAAKVREKREGTS
ncbi:MAG: hypothetical protein DCC68_22385 [Planctomycetota bacterium]|nr:MAG: hypothetical protein DCC68_22385 [Planctomycetota bacterium]